MSAREHTSAERMSAEADRLRRQLRRVQEATAADAAEAEARIERLLGRCAGLESQLAARASERSEDDFFRSIMPTRPEPRAPEPPAVPYTGPLRITAVEVKVLCVPLVRPGATCSAQDEVLVLVHTHTETRSAPSSKPLGEKRSRRGGTHNVMYEIKHASPSLDPRGSWT